MISISAVFFLFWNCQGVFESILYSEIKQKNRDKAV